MIPDKLTAVNIIICAVLVGCSCNGPCQSGWFGLRCAYKCRCTSDKCDTDGNCEAGSKCDHGWFGPQCQYVDLAFQKSKISELTDELDNTCINDKKKTSVNIPLHTSISFTWLRLVFHSGGNHSVMVYFNINTTFVTCSDTAFSTVSTTLDIHCSLQERFHNLVLESDIWDLCSVYVSGGRLISIKQKTVQSTPYYENSAKTGNHNISYLAWRAVDGDTNTDFYKGNSCAKAVATPIVPVYWRMRFEGEKTADRYWLYFVDNSSIYEYGISVYIYNAQQIKLFILHVNGSDLTPVYKFAHRVPRIADMYIRTSAPSLALCEVTVFGDSVCGDGLYGRDCELACNCPADQVCYTSTGECHPACKVGYEGDNCIPCKTGMYGRGCTNNCSEVCFRNETILDVCDLVHGTCLHGCRVGRTSRLCNPACTASDKGKDCPCNPGCAEATNASESACDPVNGTCLFGCAAGHLGTDCSTTCETGMYGPACSFHCDIACVRVLNGTKHVCDVSSGICSSGCEHTFRGPHCNLTCLVDTFGKNCNQNCSPACARHNEERICDVNTGDCIQGCTAGYIGAKCTHTCDIGTYGKNCKNTCSSNCNAPDSRDTSACSHIDGSCLFGCVEDFAGSLCDKDAANASSSEGEIPMEGVNTLLVMTLFFPLTCITILMICIKSKKKKIQAAEEELGSAIKSATITTTTTTVNA